MGNLCIPVFVFNSSSTRISSKQPSQIATENYDTAFFCGRRSLGIVGTPDNFFRSNPAKGLANDPCRINWFSILLTESLNF